MSIRSLWQGRGVLRIAGTENGGMIPEADILDAFIAVRRAFQSADLNVPEAVILKSNDDGMRLLARINQGNLVLSAGRRHQVRHPRLVCRPALGAGLGGSIGAAHGRVNVPQREQIIEAIIREAAKLTNGISVAR